MEERPTADEAGHAGDLDGTAVDLLIARASVGEESGGSRRQRLFRHRRVGLVGGEDAGGEAAEAAAEVGGAKGGAGADGGADADACSFQRLPDGNAVVDVGDVPEVVGLQGGDMLGEGSRVERACVIGESANVREALLG